MKTAISIPDDLFKRADRLAKQRKVSRSQLYAEAIAELLIRQQSGTLRDQANRLADSAETSLQPTDKARRYRRLRSVEW